MEARELMKLKGKIVIYVRVSTEQQADSLESQLHRCHGYLMSMGFKQKELNQIAQFVDTGSGKDTARPAYQRMMREVRLGKVKFIVFPELSRISRSLHDFLSMQDDWNLHGVHWASVVERFDTTTDSGELIVRIMMSLNEFERKQTARRTRANMLARAQMGKWNGGAFPLGYKAGPEKTGTLLVEDDEAHLIREMFDLYLATGGPNPTATELTRRGYRTRKGKPISWVVVDHALHNPVYIGLKEINRKRRTLAPSAMAELPEKERYSTTTGLWDPIIDMDTWEKVKVLREANKVARNATKSQKYHDYVLTGLVRCSGCGHILEGGGGKGNAYFYYRHPTNTKTDACIKRSYHAEAVEASVLKRLRKYLQNEPLLKRIIGQTNAQLCDEVPVKELEVQEAKRKEAGLGSNRENLIANLTNAPAGSIPASFWEKVKELEVQAEQAHDNTLALEKELEALKSRQVTPKAWMEALHRFDEVYEHLNRHEKQELLRYFIVSVDINGAEVAISLFGEDPEICQLPKLKPRSRGGSGKNKNGTTKGAALVAHGWNEKRSGEPKFSTPSKWLRQ